MLSAQACVIQEAVLNLCRDLDIDGSSFDHRTPLPYEYEVASRCGRPSLRLIGIAVCLVRL